MKIVKFKFIVVVFSLIGCMSEHVFSNENLYPLITNVPNRNFISLNGQWNYIIDPYETGYYDYRLNESKWGFFLDSKPKNESDMVEYNFDESAKMQIPHDWNTWSSELLYYEGTLWFHKPFDLKKKEDKRYFIYFGAVNYEAIVYLNGKRLGIHKGGFTPFNFEVTEKVKPGRNVIVVKVDNKRHQDEVPTVNTDWWNYGGITRDVLVLEESKAFISDYSIQLSKDKKNEISGWILLDGNTKKTSVKIEIPELSAETTVISNSAEKVFFKVKATPELWSPENPRRYSVTISTPTDKLEDQIAFRTIKTIKNKIFLNGKQIYLKGISIHEEAPYRQGRINSAEEARTLLQWAKDMNCNFVRLAHYPHNEYMVREAEKMGILVWDEIPVYWTISFEKEETLEKAKAQLKEMIVRDRNRGAVIIWSLANETPHSEIRNKFLTALAKYARELDDTRFISMAMEKQYEDTYTPVIADPLMDVVDVVSFNSYIGWYDGLPDKCAKMNWKVPADKPVIISEFGGGALQGKHGNKTERWTEEFQEDLYIQSVKMFDKVEIAGTTPWILMDFRSPRRLLPGIQDGFNRKGLVSSQGIPKKAFFVMKEWYSSK